MATSAIWSVVKCPQCKQPTSLDGEVCVQCEKDNQNPKKQFDKLYLFDLEGEPETHIRIKKHEDYPETIIWGTRVFTRDPEEKENEYFECKPMYIGNPQ